MSSRCRRQGRRTVASLRAPVTTTQRLRPAAVTTILIRLATFLACSSPGRTPTPIPTPTATVLERYVAESNPAVSRFGTVVKSVTAALTGKPDPANPARTQREGVTLGSSEVTSLSALTPEEIVKALNTRPKPVIPTAYEASIVDSITALESGLAAIDKIARIWPTILAPEEARRLHKAQAAHRVALRSLYVHLLVMKQMYLETGAESNEAILERKILALQVELAYRDLSYELDRINPNTRPP